jgi:hypothetical protein
VGRLSLPSKRHNHACVRHRRNRFIGPAVVRELLSGGHEVVGLARSDEAAAALTAGGAEVHRGALDELDSLHDRAATADGVIHTAFNNISDSTDFSAACRADLRAVETLGEALAGSDRRFVVTSGPPFSGRAASRRKGTCLIPGRSRRSGSPPKRRRCRSPGAASAYRWRDSHCRFTATVIMASSRPSSASPGPGGGVGVPGRWL